MFLNFHTCLFAGEPFSRGEDKVSALGGGEVYVMLLKHF